MKTTYKFKTKESETPNIPFTEVYLSVKSRAEGERQSETKEAKAAQHVEENMSAMVEKEMGNVRKKKKSKLPLVIFLIIILAAVSVAGVFIYRKQSLNKEYEDLNSEVSSWYNDGLSANEEMVEDAMSKLKDLEEKGVSVDALKEDLLSMGLYLSDSKLLEEMQDANYNLLDSELKSNLEGIKSNLESYTIEDLYKGISEKCTALETEYNNYVSLRLSLQSVTDVSKFKESDYEADILSITHELNKSELNSIVQTIIADKKLAKAQADLDALSTPDAEGNLPQVDEATMSAAVTARDKALKKQQSTQKALLEIQGKLSADNTDDLGDTLE